MKGDESKKGQERGSTEGPRRGEHRRPPGFAPSRSLRASHADPPLQIICAAPPASACQGSCSDTAFERGWRRSDTLKLAQLEPASPPFLLRHSLSPISVPLPSFAYLRGRSWLRRNITRGRSRAGQPGLDRSFSPLPAFVGTAVFFVSASHPHFLRLGQKQIAPSSLCPSLPANSFDQESPAVPPADIPVLPLPSLHLEAETLGEGAMRTRISSPH